MASVGIRELRQRASELLRRVAGGESIEVTDRGRPVAILAPLPDGTELDRLLASGDIEPAQGSLDELPEPLPLRPGQEAPSAVLPPCDAMSADRATYLDSSALVKLAVQEPESGALRRYLRRRSPYVSSAIARTEVMRALLPFGQSPIRRGQEVLARINLVRVNDRVLATAGSLLPKELRPLDAIHLATAREIGSDVAQLVVYDDRMAEAARDMGWLVRAPA